MDRGRVRGGCRERKNVPSPPQLLCSHLNFLLSECRTLAMQAPGEKDDIFLHLF